MCNFFFGVGEVILYATPDFHNWKPYILNDTDLYPSETPFLLLRFNDILSVGVTADGDVERSNFSRWLKMLFLPCRIILNNPYILQLEWGHFSIL